MALDAGHLFASSVTAWLPPGHFPARLYVRIHRGFPAPDPGGGPEAFASTARRNWRNCFPTCPCRFTDFSGSGLNPRRQLARLSRFISRPPKETDRWNWRLDLEGVLVPEIWIAFAERTGIEELRATTRDIPDYDVLMKQRLRILDQHNLKIGDIQAVIATLAPAGRDRVRRLAAGTLPGDYPVGYLYEFSEPLMRQLKWPTLFATAWTDESGRVVDYKLRQKDPKRPPQALHSLNYRVSPPGIPTTTPPCWPRPTWAL